MAGKTRRRRRTTRRNAPAVSRPNPKRRRVSRRRSSTFRRNPPAGLANLVGFAQDAAMTAGGVLAGKIVARKGRAFMGQMPGSVVGIAAEAGIGLVAGFLASRVVGVKIGQSIAAGGLLAPMETVVQRLGIPHVSDALGDDGYYLGADTGVQLVNAYDAEYVGDGGMAGYVAGVQPTTMAGYVDG